MSSQIPDARTEYKDIFDHEHHVSKKRPQMSRINRAAQFAPFAALTGYDDLVRESARETEDQRFLDENSIEELNDKLVFLFQQSDPLEASFTYFVRDSKKAGGKYVTVSGKAVRYDEYEQSITLENGDVIFIEDISEIECSAFNALWDY